MPYANYLRPQPLPICPDVTIGTPRIAGNPKRSFNCARQNRAICAFGETKPVPKNPKLFEKLLSPQTFEVRMKRQARRPALLDPTTLAVSWLVPSGTLALRLASLQINHPED
jgi:hypothetical protein